MIGNNNLNERISIKKELLKIFANCIKSCPSKRSNINSISQILFNVLDIVFKCGF